MKSTISHGSIAVKSPSPQAPAAPPFAVVFASFLLLGVPSTLFAIAWPSVRETLGLDQEIASILLALQFGGYFFASCSSGRIESVLGAKGSLTVATGAIAFGLATLAAGQTWLGLLLSSVVIGIGQGVLDGVVNIVAARRFRHRWMQWLHASFGVGSSATPILAQTAMTYLGSWRAPYIIVATLAALLCGLTHKSRAVLSAPRAARHHDASPPLSATLSYSALWFGVVVFVVVGGLELTAGQWTYSLLTESRGLNTPLASALVSLFWASFTMGRFVAGWSLKGEYSGQSSVVLRCCLAGVAVGALGLCRTTTTLPAILIFGFFLGPLFPLLIGDTSFRFGPIHAPNAIGVLVASSSIGLVTMPAFGGVLANRNLELVPGFLFAQALALITFWESCKYARTPSMRRGRLE
jgi:fucose permease